MLHLGPLQQKHTHLSMGKKMNPMLNLAKSCGWGRWSWRNILKVFLHFTGEENNAWVMMKLLPMWRGWEELCLVSGPREGQGLMSSLGVAQTWSHGEPVAQSSVLCHARWPEPCSWHCCKAWCWSGVELLSRANICSTGISLSIFYK